MNVTVSRGGGGDISVPVTALRRVHLTRVTGGVGRQLKRPRIGARIFCTDIPDGARFGHSCMHGPPPHDLLVLVKFSEPPPGRSDNFRTVDELARLAWELERLAEAYRLGLLAEGGRDAE